MGKEIFYYTIQVSLAFGIIYFFPLCKWYSVYIKKKQSKNDVGICSVIDQTDPFALCRASEDYSLIDFVPNLQTPNLAATHRQVRTTSPLFLTLFPFYPLPFRYSLIPSNL